MDIQDRYDELDDFLSGLKVLRSDVKSEDLREEIDYLLYEAGYDDEKDELEKELAKQWEEEERQANLEFERSRL